MWQALTSRCAAYALRRGQAAVFDPAVSVFGAMADRSAASWHDLAELVAEHPELNRSTCLFGSRIEVPDGWIETGRLRCRQMVLDQPAVLPALPAGLTVVPLDRADLTDVTALIELTRPGPWGERTIDLGGYLGVRDAGRLVGMAGWRIQLDGATGAWTEVSGVCVHPDQRGRGLAAAVTARVAAAARARAARSTCTC